MLQSITKAASKLDFFFFLIMYLSNKKIFVSLGSFWSIFNNKIGHLLDWLIKKQGYKKQLLFVVSYSTIYKKLSSQYNYFFACSNRTSARRNKDNFITCIRNIKGKIKIGWKIKRCTYKYRQHPFLHLFRYLVSFEYIWSTTFLECHPMNILFLLARWFREENKKQTTFFLTPPGLLFLLSIPDQQIKYKLSREPLNEHSDQIWFQLS